jgi:Glycosyl transferase family 90
MPWGILKVEKRDGTLRCLNSEGFESRNPSTLWCMRQADAIYNWPDFPPTEIHTEDKGGDALLSYSKQNPITAAEYARIIPDFTFHCWAETGMMDYETTMAAIDAAGRQPARLNKMGWIGNLLTSTIRAQMFEIAKQYPDLMDVHSMEWHHTGGQTLRGSKYISVPELVAMYGILVDVEGNGWSARTKYLLWSHRPLLIVDRPHKEYYYEHLRPWTHYIPVKRDLSDLVERVEWVLANPAEASAIAEAAYQFACQHLTRAAAYKQWDRVISGLLKPAPNV